MSHVFADFSLLLSALLIAFTLNTFRACFCSASPQVAESDPRFLRKHLVEVVQAMLTVANAAELEDATRSLAAEFLVTLCEARDKAPGMMRKLPTFAEKLFGVLMNFLLDVEVRAQPCNRNTLHALPF